MSVWRTDVASWGRVVSGRHRVSRPANLKSAVSIVAAEDETSVLGHGCGRSYGDSPLNPEGRLVDCLGLDRFIDFDRTSGVLTCESGVQLAEILAVICRPDPDGAGWFLPVTPGTRFVTVGGAIANDVHGKNHHSFGTFGRHVLSFDLTRSDGMQLTCSRTENPALFAATIGGLGLTGLVLRATLQLRRVPGLTVQAEDIRFSRLEEFFGLARESDADWEYTAAWIDCLAVGTGLGRGIFSRARHHAGEAIAPPLRTPRLSMPITPPLSLANTMTVRAFNAAYWRKLGKTHHRASRIGSYEPVLYPLDAIGNWNRVYGPNGFFQLQTVVPMAVSQDAIGEMLKVIARSGQGSILSVLKVFGDLPSPGLMSFPMSGTTLALDFPNQGAATLKLLTTLEAITVQANGRLYPAKDGTMTAATLKAGYPGIDAFLPWIDPKFSSALARRLSLVASTAN